MNYDLRALSGAVDIPDPETATMANEGPDDRHQFGWVEAFRIALICFAAVGVHLHLSLRGAAAEGQPARYRRYPGRQPCPDGCTCDLPARALSSCG